MRVLFAKEKGQRVPIRTWARALSDETVRQFERLASDQEDLVTRRTRLEPVAVLKG